MKWIRFDFDKPETWPKYNSKVIIRYRDNQSSIKYSIVTWWFKTEDTYAKSNSFKIFNYFDTYDQPYLYHNKNKSMSGESFVTHWTYLEEPTDGYWKEYKHDNGNVYADHAWINGYPSGPAGEKFYDLLKESITTRTTQDMFI